MPLTDAQIEMIFSYFDNELSDDEEKVFMAELQDNAELQQAFDQHILASQYLAKDEKPLTHNQKLEAADEFITSVKNKYDNKTADIAKLPARNKNIRFWVAAAAIIVALTISYALFYLIKRNKPNDALVQKTETNRIPKTLIDSSSLVADNLLMEQLYKENYTELSQNELTIPSSATSFSYLYENQRYKEMTEKSEEELKVKGQINDHDKTRLLNYFDFYKALSNIAIGKTTPAEMLLKNILANNKNDLALTYQTQWYLMMVYLKEGNKQSALAVANEIINEKQNPYNKKTTEVVKALKK